VAVLGLSRKPSRLTVLGGSTGSLPVRTRKGGKKGRVEARGIDHVIESRSGRVKEES